MRNVTTIPQESNSEGLFPSIIDALKSLLQSVFKFSSPSPGGKDDDNEFGNTPVVTAVKVKVSGAGNDVEDHLLIKDIILETKDSVEEFDYDVTLDFSLGKPPTPQKGKTITYNYGNVGHIPVKITLQKSGKKPIIYNVPYSISKSR